jgi:hypothetical protein
VSPDWNRGDFLATQGVPHLKVILMNNYNLTSHPVAFTAPLQGAGTVAASRAADDSHARDIQVAFSQGGLLVRTVQKKNAHQDLHNCAVTPDQAKALHDSRASSHGGLRKWSLGHADLRPNYFGMGTPTGIPRHMAFLALPEKMGDHVIGVHKRDQGSGRPPVDPMVKLASDARMELKALLGELTSEQRGTPTEAIGDNNEIQTIGIRPEAVAGMLFTPSPSVRTWEAAKNDFQKAINAAGPEFEGRSFPIFSYDTSDATHKTELRLLDTLSKQS